MSGNTLGTLFTVTTAGESHGAALLGIVDGCPPGLALASADLRRDLDRRKPGNSRFTTQRREADEVQILSGVFEGKTTGTPIGLLIPNTDERSRDYTKIQDQFRPGHGDFTYQRKYGIRDHRGGGRASARGTAIWVAAGAIAKKYLAEFYGVTIQGHLAQMGSIRPEQFNEDYIETNPFFFPDPDKIEALEHLIHELRRAGDSIGALVKVVAKGVPYGLGEPVFDRLDADLAKGMMAINAVKAVAIGDGFEVVEQRGSQHRDEITPQGFLSNHAGGILAGISTGQAITVSLALKPTSSILLPGRSINTKGEVVSVSTTGRHDPCVGIRAIPIAEAVMALVLMDHVLRDRGQNVRPISS